MERLPKQCWRHFGSGLKDDENSKDFYLPLGLIWRDEVKRGSGGRFTNQGKSLSVIFPLTKAGVIKDTQSRGNQTRQIYSNSEGFPEKKIL